jgi:hypothetical protein
MRSLLFIFDSFPDYKMIYQLSLTGFNVMKLDISHCRLNWHEQTMLLAVVVAMSHYISGS